VAVRRRAAHSDARGTDGRVRYCGAVLTKARKKLSYTATAFVPLGAVPGNM
jgi:hypothetical protein